MSKSLLFFFFSVLTVYAQQPISSEVKMYQGKPSIIINGKAQYPIIYSLTDVPGGRWSWEELPQHNLKSFCKLGVSLVQVDLALDHVWRADNSITIDTALLQVRGVINACPNSAIFIRLHVNPPKWWQKKYPSENTKYADTSGKPDIDFGIQRLIEDDEETPIRTSIASAKWKNEASIKVSEFLKALSATPEGNHIAGIQVAGGVYGEWHYWGFIENEPDVSEPMNEYFREWLKTKYKTEAGLKKAWSDQNVTFTTVTVPDTSERFKTLHGIFRDPSKERKTIDYYYAQHESVADAILHFCRVVKNSWPRPIITGAFYGYFYSVFGREAAGGHLQLQKILNSKDIDYLSAPGTYYPNAVEMGEPYRSRGLINSMTLHGKLWLDEMDQQPQLMPLKDKNFKTSLAKGIAQVRRNTFFTFSKGHGLWFYDFGPSGFNGGPRLQDHGSWGWWDEPSLQKDIKQLKSLLDEQYQKPYTTAADVLLVHDTESFYHLGSSKKQSSFMHWTNNWPIVAIFKSGVVHDVIHLQDLDKVNLNQYKAIVFMNTVVLEDAQRKWIKSEVAANGRHLIWIYAPGYSNNKTLNPSFVKELTGFDMKEVMDENNYRIKFDSTITKNEASIFNSKFGPAFYADNVSPTEKLGTLLPINTAGFAVKKNKNHTTWWMAIAPNDAAVWRHIFTKAGAHVYHHSDHIVYEGNGLLAVHTARGGEINLQLKSGKSITLTVDANSTTIIDSESGTVMHK